MRKSDLLFAFSVTLMLAVLVNIPFASAVPDEPTSGTDEKSTGESGSGWSIAARVRGDWVYQWRYPPFEHYYTILNHYANRSTWYSMVIDGSLVVYGQSDSYNQSASTPNGSSVEFNSTIGHYHYARSRAETWFYDWLWGVHWHQWTNWTPYIQEY